MSRTQYLVAYEDGAHRCYSTATGVDRHFVGCTHEHPADAVAHSKELAASIAPDWTEEPE